MSTPPLKLERPATGRNTLVAATPFTILLDELTSDITRIKRRTPSCPDIATLERFRDDLRRALDEARRINVWLTTREVHELTRRPISTITRICRDEGERAGAYWVKGAWAIHWPTFEAFLRTRPEQAA